MGFGCAHFLYLSSQAIDQLSIQSFSQAKNLNSSKFRVPAYHMTRSIHHHLFDHSPSFVPHGVLRQMVVAVYTCVRVGPPGWAWGQSRTHSGMECPTGEAGTT